MAGSSCRPPGTRSTLAIPPRSRLRTLSTPASRPCGRGRATEWSAAEMGESFMILFPADPLWPKPDWPRLRTRLLECGFLRDPKLRPVDFGVARHLWERIVADRGRPDLRAPYAFGGLNTLV